MKRIYLKAYTNMNFGDDLFVYIICRRYPEVKFYLSCSKFSDDAFECIENLTIMNRTHLKGMIIQNVKRLMNKCSIQTNFPFDGQVYIGGSIFIQPSDWYKECNYEKELYEYRLNKNLPFFILGANFGPYDDDKFVKIHKKFFETEISDICFRDRWSYDIFNDVAKVRYAPDIVCTYQLPKVKKENLILISCIYNDGREGLPHFENEVYFQKMAEVCDQYWCLGKQVCLVSLCKAQGDEISCLEIKKRCKGEIQTVFYRGNIDEIIQLFARAEYVIASRFHAMILSWLADTPVYPISYNNKTEQVIRNYGFAGKYITIQDIDFVDFKTVDENRNNQYIFNIETIVEEADKQFEVLDDFLRG